MPTSAILLLARIMIAAIFIQSGFGKLMNPAGATAYIAQNGFPVPQLAYYVAVAVEFFGGLAFLVGVQTRWVSLALALFTLGAGIGVHYHPDNAGQMIHFMKNIAIAGAFLTFVANGAGALSVDGMLGKGRAATA